MKTSAEAGARAHSSPVSTSLVVLSAVLLCLLLPGGCGFDGGEQERRAREGIVIVGTGTAAQSLDPRVGTSLDSFRIQQLVYTPLTDQDAAGRIVPALAEDWQEEETAVGGEKRWRWRFRLRQGVRFHDGRKLTPGDVVYTFKSLLSPEFVSRKKAAFDFVESVAAEPPDSVVFILKQPQPWFPAALAAVGIVQEGYDGESPPVGTGPFQFESREGSRSFTLTANDDYYLGPPGVRRLVIKVVPDQTTMALELMHGSIDIAINDLSTNDIPLLRRRGLRVVTAPGLTYEYIGVNHRHPILSIRLVRQAIAYAIDRKTIIDTYLNGLARPAVSPLLPQLWAGEPEFFSYDYNPDKARRLLDAAGFPDPDGPGPEPRFRVDYKCSTNRGGRDLASILKDQLSRVGIALEIRSLEFQTFYADIVSGNFALYQLRWIGIVNPDFFGAAFHSSSVPGTAHDDALIRRGSFNRGRYDNPEVDALIEAAEKTTNLNDRWRILNRLQGVISNDLPYIDLWYRENYAVARADLEGIELTLNASFATLRKLRYQH